MSAVTSLPSTAFENRTAELELSPLASRVVEGVVLALICALALSGNIALWLVVCLSRSLRTLSNVLLLCLSAADILVSAVNMPVTVYTILVGEWRFSDNLCMAFGFVNMTTFIASVMSLAAISWNRYVAVCKSNSFKGYFTATNTALVVVGVWVLSLLLATPPLVGWGVYAFLPRQSFCFCDWQTSVSYTFFMVATCFGGPCISMAYCYVGILKEVRASRRRVANFDTGAKPKDASSQVKTASASYINSSSAKVNTITPRPVTLSVSSILIRSSVMSHQQRQLQKRIQEDLRLSFSLLLVVVIFIIAWMPFCVTMFWSVFDPENPPPPPLDLSTLILGYANSCCNPIIYGIMNKRFNHAFRLLFKCKCYSVSRIVPSSFPPQPTTRVETTNGYNG